MSSHFIVRLMVICGCGFLFFFIRELMTADPVVDLRAFLDRNYTVGVMIGFIASLILYGTTLLIPLFYQLMLGYPAFDAGLGTAARGIGSLLSMAVMGAIMNKVDSRYLMVPGLILGAASTWALGSISPAVGSPDLWWPQFFQGIAMGMIFVPAGTLTYATISKEKMGNATSLFNLTRNIGGSVGISISTTLIARGTQVKTAILGSYIHSGNHIVANSVAGLNLLFLSHGFDRATAYRMSCGVIFEAVQQQAWILSFIRISRLFGLLFLILIPACLLLRKDTREGKDSLPMGH